MKPSDVESLRVPNALNAPELRTEKLITNIPVGKPGKQTFFRTPHDVDLFFDLCILEDHHDGKRAYAVAQAVAVELRAEVVVKRVMPYCTGDYDIGLLALTLETVDGRSNDWNRSLWHAAEKARTQWLRLQSNMREGRYDIYVAPNFLREPIFPDWTINQYIERAFRERFIDSLEHPLVRRLRGES